MQYSPQSHVAFWLSSNERFQTSKNPSVLLQSIRDGTFVWRILTVHLNDAPPPAATITERWKQIAAALLDCGAELTSFGLKMILLGDPDTIDKLLNVLFSLHHAGSQGTSVVANLITPCIPEPDPLYPKLFHSALVNAKQHNFVDRVKLLTDGCCTSDTSVEEKEMLQLEALTSHSKRLVEYGLAEELYRQAIQLLNRQRTKPASLKAAALLKSFVLEVGPESSYRSLLGIPPPKGAAAAQQSKAQQQQQHDALVEVVGSPSSVAILRDLSEILQSPDALPELVDFIRILLFNITASSSGATNDGSRLMNLMLHLFPPSQGHRVALEQYWLMVTRVADRTMVKPIVPRLTAIAVAILEGRDPTVQDSYERFNPNGRFEEGFAEVDVRTPLSAGGRMNRSGANGTMFPTAADSNSSVTTVEGDAGTTNSVPVAQTVLPRPRLSAYGDDEEDEDQSKQAAKRTAELRLKIQRQLAQERRELDVCAVALRICLRLWSEFPDLAKTSDCLFDAIEFLRTRRGLDLSARPELLSELACAMFAHPMFFSHAMATLEQVQTYPELRRILFQNLCDFLSRPRSELSGDADAWDTNAGPPSGASAGDPNAFPPRAVQILSVFTFVCDNIASWSPIGEIEGQLLMAIANGVIDEFRIRGPSTIARLTTAASEALEATPSTVSPAHVMTPPLSSRSFANSNDGTLASGPSATVAGGDDDEVDMQTVSTLMDLLLTQFDQDPFGQRFYVAPWATFSAYFFSLLPNEPIRMEYLQLCSANINELLTLSERHPVPDSILEAIAQVFLEHNHEGRRLIAEVIHMFFQTVVRRDPANMVSAESQASDVFVKRLKKLCELVGMPTTRVKVKVLDEEEAARLAALRRAEEEERKRVAAEDAERVRRETMEREEQLAKETGKEVRKKFERKPLYVAPEPMRPGEFGKSSIFEYKRDLQWVKSNLVLGLLMERVQVALAHRQYERNVVEVKKKDNITTTTNGTVTSPSPVPETFWSGWQKGKKYEEHQQEKRRQEQEDAERREVLRKIRAQEVKQQLGQVSYNKDMKKLQQLFTQEQQHAIEEENDLRQGIRQTYLKGLVQLYHVYREESSYFAEVRESAQRSRADEMRRKQEEDRKRVKQRVARYWEEREYLESQLVIHRQQEEAEEQQRQEERKKQYLEQQKRRLMTWRLQNQYEVAGAPPGDSAFSDSTTEQPFSSESVRTSKKQQVAASSSSSSPQRANSNKSAPPAVAAGSALAAAKATKLAPINKRNSSKALPTVTTSSSPLLPTENFVVPDPARGEDAVTTTTEADDGSPVTIPLGEGVVEAQSVIVPTASDGYEQPASVSATDER